jgi:hypothetical protein
MVLCLHAPDSFPLQRIRRLALGTCLGRSAHHFRWSLELAKVTLRLLGRWNPWASLPPRWKTSITT